MNIYHAEFQKLEGMLQMEPGEVAFFFKLEEQELAVQIAMGLLQITEDRYSRAKLVDLLHRIAHPTQVEIN